MKTYPTFLLLLLCSGLSVAEYKTSGWQTGDKVYFLYSVAGSEECNKKVSSFTIKEIMGDDAKIQKTDGSFHGKKLRAIAGYTDEKEAMRIKEESNERCSKDKEILRKFE